MRTTKNISSIAYHRPEVFAAITADLVKAGTIGPCLWIAHKGEDGDKDHIHLLLLGGFKTYETNGLGTLWGYDIEGDEKRSVSALWKATKNPSDWLLYGVHDAQYLALKGLERANHYTWEDVKCSPGSEEVRAELIRDAKDHLQSAGDRTTARLVALAKHGFDWRRVVLSGIVPMGQFSQAARAWHYIEDEFCPRVKDPKTGREVKVYEVLRQEEESGFLPGL